MSKSPVSFVIDHLDNCEHCSSGNFCATGIQLMHRGAQVAAQMMAPIPEIPKGKAKA